jgi:hypothetical protein
MITKKTMVLAAAAILAVTSAVRANDKDSSDTGGFHIGPLGQPMGAPHAWGANAPWGWYYSGAGGSPYAYSPREPFGRNWSSEP